MKKIEPEIKQAAEKETLPDIDLSEQHIRDSQLQMLFAICHPSISKEAQVCLALRVLCGFGIEEIANAFLSNKETIGKRLQRAKEKLRQEKAVIEFPAAAEVQQRLDAVLLTLYLLYNEGYYSESEDSVLREDLCLEAMRLTKLLIENETSNTAQVNALFALMCFHASRFAARKDGNGEMILYDEQDEDRWNKKLIEEGAYYLHKASGGTSISKYHLEASIAYWHTVKDDTEKWEQILQLYNHLLQIAYSPIAALNRTYALAKVRGKQTAIMEAEQLQLKDNPYYYTLLAELHQDSDKDKAKGHYITALSLAKTNAERQTLQKKIASLQ